MNEDLVSVIIPVYNVEKYIKRCILSVLDQTYKNLEIIIIDDGSKDNSLSIARDTSKTDNRVTIIHKKNEGISSTRNLGIDKATGKYIVFVDSDDYLDPNYVERFHKVISDNNADIAVNYSYYINDNASIKSNNTNIEIRDSLDISEYIYTGKVMVAVWNKIYNLDFLKKNNIKFDPEIWYGEGMLFNIMCLQKTEKVPAMNEDLYHQTQNPNSAMRKFNLESNFCGIRSMNKQKLILKRTSKRLERAWAFHLRCYNMSLLKGLIRTNAYRENYSTYKECIKGLRKNLRAVLFAPVNTKTKMLYLLAFIAPVKTAKILNNKEKSIYI
jgi:glycosyltransferase involved in cell wall biosynthesis